VRRRHRDPARRPSPAIARPSRRAVAAAARARPATGRRRQARLAPTHHGSILTRDITELFGRNPKLDDDLLDEIETALLTADVGVTATTALVESCASG
jgi:fused signal recognition particle receptor